MKALSRETRRLLRPMNLASNDRMSIRMSEDSQFECEIFAIAPRTSRNSALQELARAGKRSAAAEWDTENMGAVTEALRDAYKCLQNGAEDDAHTILKEINGQCTDAEVQRSILRVREIIAEPDEQRTYASWQAASEFPKRVPERKEITAYHNGWKFAATDITAALIALWPREQLVFETEAARITFEYLLMTAEQQDQAAEVYAQYKTNGKVPEFDFVDHPDYPLSPYQIVCLFNAMNSEGYAELMEQGTGKTPIVIARIMNEALALRESGETRMYRALIVCPKNVRMNWQSEVGKFATQQGNVHVIRGGPMARVKGLIDAFKPGEPDDLYTVVVMHYEAIVSCWEALKLIEWDLAVVDESHYIKANKTKRTQGCHKVRDTAKSRMILTGTPVNNSIMDLYAQLEFLGKGWSGFTSHGNFKNFYGKHRINEQGHRALVGIQNLPFMQERLARLSFIIHKEEALPDLPDKVYTIREVSMTPVQRDIYRQLAEKLAVEIETEMETAENKALVVNNILTKLLRLAQITSGHIVWDQVNDDDGNELQARSVEEFADNPKIDALVELVEELPKKSKMIIWACFVTDIKAIKRALDKAGHKSVTYYGATNDADREKAVHDFNHDPDTRFFIGNPGAGATGLNLIGYPPGREDEWETNCDHVVYFSQDWSMPKRSQSEDRAHRRGTRNHVQIIDLCVPGSIDEEIRTRVTQKRAHALEVSDVRSVLARVLNPVEDD